MRKMLEHVRTVHDLDYIMITGDYPAHDVWLQSRYNKTQWSYDAIDSSNGFNSPSIVL